MTLQRRPRLLLALHEGVLRDALLRVLDAHGIDDIVVCDGTQAAAGDYDLALVAGDPPDGVRSPIVISVSHRMAGRRSAGSGPRDEDAA